MKTRTPFAFYIFDEAEGELVSDDSQPGPSARVPFEIKGETPHQLVVSVPSEEDGDPMPAAEVLVEVYDGEVVAYMWSENTIGDDPDARVVLLEDAADRPGRALMASPSQGSRQDHRRPWSKSTILSVSRIQGGLTG